MAEITNIIDPKAIEDIMKCNTSLLQTDKTLQDLLKTVNSFQDAMNNVSNSNDDAKTKSSEYAKILNKAAEEQNRFTATAKELQNQQKQITNTEAKLNTINTQANKTLTEKKAILREQNELLKIEGVLNDKNAGTLQKAQAANRKLQIEKQKLNLETEEGKKRLLEINAAQDKNNQVIQDSSNKLQKQKINVGNYRESLNGLFVQFKNGEIGMKQLAKGILQVGKNLLIAFVTNPILLAITAIVGAVVALFKAFKSTDSGATELAARFEQLKAVIDVVRQYVAGLAKAIVALFSGDKQKAADEYNNAVSISKERFIEAAKAAKAYTYELDRIEDSENNYISRSAEIRNQIAKLEYTAQDRTKSTSERKKALEDALKLGEQELQFQKKIADDRLKAEIDYLAAKSGVRAEDIKSFILMTDEEQSTADASLKNVRDNYEAKFKEIEELYAKSIDLDTKFFEENKRNVSRLTGFIEEENNKRKKIADDLAKEQIDSLRKSEEQQRDWSLKMTEINNKMRKDQKEIDDEFWAGFENNLKEQETETKAQSDFLINEAQREYDRKVAIIKATSKTEEDAQQRLFELDKKTYQNTIDQLTKSLEYSNLTEEKKWELRNQLADAQMELDNLVTEHEIDNAKKSHDKRKELNDALYSSLKDVTSSLFDFTQQMYANDLAALEEKNEKGQLSEKEYAKKKAEIEIKQAKAAKLQGIFNATIKTAEAIIGYLSDPGGVAGAILSVAAGITGGLQIASILSQPLPTVPAFGKGTENSPSTFIAGERGRELMRFRTGEIQMVDQPTLFSGEKFKGAHIFSNPETEKIMTYHSGLSRDDRTLTSEIRGLRRDIRNKPVFIFDENNRVIGRKIGNHTEKIMNKYKYGIS